MSRGLFVVLIALACSTKEERTRQAAKIRLARDSLLTAGVVTTLQPPASAGRLIYDRPADLSYDSLLANRPELARASDRRKTP